MVDVRLQPGQLAAVDARRTRQPKDPTRSELIERLVEMRPIGDRWRCRCTGANKPMYMRGWIGLAVAVTVLWMLLGTCYLALSTIHATHISSLQILDYCLRAVRPAWSDCINMPPSYFVDRRRIWLRCFSIATVTSLSAWCLGLVIVPYVRRVLAGRKR